MGALRAVELNAFGMQGVGKIYNDYLKGNLDRDDEVTVVHAPESLNFMPLSEALVNIRYTFKKAQAKGIIDANCCLNLIELADSTFYKERSYNLIINRSVNAGLINETQAKRLIIWLASNKINQKREDAMDLVRNIGHIQNDCPFEFLESQIWKDNISI